MKGYTVAGDTKSEVLCEDVYLFFIMKFPPFEVLRKLQFPFSCCKVYIHS